MKPQKICIIGDGLTGLTTAAILGKQNIDIDLYSDNKKKIQIIDTRTTAISESNFQYIKSTLNLSSTNFFWACKKVKLFYQDENKIINFLNFNEKNKKFMYIFQNQDLKKKLNKIISKKKNIKLIKKKVEAINSNDGFVTVNKKKIFYDLIILSIGGLSNFYSRIDAGRSIKKSYDEIAITTQIKHKTNIQNASQFFLKEGPLAILPYKKNFFSIVWSVSNNYFNINQSNLKKILSKKLEMLLNNNKIINIGKIKSFPINLNLKIKYFKKNILILGDGLHAIHPIAGQGFNLVLRDISKLAELTSKTSQLGLLFKNTVMLEDFYNSRKAENNLFGLGINLTNSFFKDRKYFTSIKKIILNNINSFGFIKKTSQTLADRGFLF
tara:strand:+ start:3719 stop:4864 length:1146 start_codon:yes stop_codon:yes gene_type:complete